MKDYFKQCHMDDIHLLYCHFTYRDEMPFNKMLFGLKVRRHLKRFFRFTIQKFFELLVAAAAEEGNKSSSYKRCREKE